jgi:hypothetical protein
VGSCTLIMEAADTSETLVNFYQITWCSIPEDSHLRGCSLLQKLNSMCSGGCSSLSVSMNSLLFNSS